MSLVTTLIFTVLAEEKSNKLQDKVMNWHCGEEGESNNDAAKLRVVYFHGKDMEPLKGYQERLTRVMDDVSNFYRDGMIAQGFASKGIPLEKDDSGQLVLHMVKGKHNADHYGHQSGREAKVEIRAALADKFDLNKEFVLVLYGQSWKLPNGRVGFYAPYYGDPGSCQRWGLCHAADSELLDPKNLKETKTRFKYTEHYGDRDQSVAKFNSFYLGGIAHELGHGFGLRHERESPEERREKGRSLMGNGNLTYREEVWNPKSKGSFLSRASALKLLAHPLFTGSNKGRFEQANGKLKIAKVADTANTLTIEGSASGDFLAYAAIVFVDPEGGSDYDARTYTTTIKGGEFSLSGILVPRKNTEIRLIICYANGEALKHQARIKRTDGKIDIGDLSRALQQVRNPATTRRKKLR